MIYSTLRIKREKPHSTAKEAPDELSSVHLHNLLSKLRHLLCASAPNYLQPPEGISIHGYAQAVLCLECLASPCCLSRHCSSKSLLSCFHGRLCTLPLSSQLRAILKQRPVTSHQWWSAGCFLPPRTNHKVFHCFCCLPYPEPGILPTFLFINNFFHLIFFKWHEYQQATELRKRNGSIPKLSEQQEGRAGILSLLWENAGMGSAKGTQTSVAS